MNKTIERQIQQIYNKVFNKVYSRTRLYQLSHGNRDAILNAVAEINSSEAYDNFAKKFSKELTKKGLRQQRGIWKKYFEAAKKFHHVALPVTYQEFEYQQMTKAIDHNFKMIKSIPQKTVEIMQHKYTSSLVEEVAKGARTRGSFARELQSHGHKNAKLIARTETAKLQTTIVENRARDLGSIAYIWLSSNDKRTRQSHKDMNGVVVFWRNTDLEKPLLDKMYGNAGEFPNCRCSPQPILDIEDLIKDHYKLYDYRTTKIRSVTKKELIEYFEKGSL